MDLTLSWRVVRRWWWMPVATVVGGALGHRLSLQITPAYEGATRLLVTRRQDEGVVQLNDIQTAERLANTFSRLITLHPALRQAIPDGRPPFEAAELRDRLSEQSSRDVP